jgi:hypothetical protein
MASMRKFPRALSTTATATPKPLPSAAPSSNAADYANASLKRGTAGIFSSRHMESVRSSYDRKQLRANFYGPREWFYLARKKMENQRARQTGSEVETVSRAISSAFPYKVDI